MHICRIGVQAALLIVLKLSQQEFIDETGIAQKDLSRALQSLTLSKAQQKVLVWKHKSSKEAGNIDFGKLDFSTYTNTIHRSLHQVNTYTCIRLLSKQLQLVTCGSEYG